jgi:hypothetical protein
MILGTVWRLLGRILKRLMLRDAFRGYYVPTDEEFKHLWQDGLIVLDTNVLLNLYVYPETERQEVLGVLEKVRDRLWLPHHVGLEYYRRRVDVIRTQLSVFDDVRKILGVSALRLNLDKLRLNKHALITVDKILATLEPELEKFETELATLEKKHVKPCGPDPIRERLESLLGSNIGQPYTDADLLKLFTEGERRYEKRIPPGYEDVKEKDKLPDFHYGGVTYRPKFGDWIIWKQILDHARQSKAKFLMLVTDDEKPDWRDSLRHRNERVLVPRPELVDEIRREADVEVFYIYSMDVFLAHAKDKLGATVSDNTIQEVTEAKEAARTLALESQDYVPSLITVTGQVGNRRDALLHCGYCGQVNIPFHFYEGEGSPKLHEVLGVFHYWQCPMIKAVGTVRAMVLRPDGDDEIVTVTMPR